MLSRKNVVAICVFCSCVLLPDRVQSQDTVQESAATSGAQSVPAARDDIPFSVLRQIVSGFSYNGEIKTDLSKEQIEAMKEAQHSQHAKCGDLNQLSSGILASPLKNRRLKEALETLKSERDAELQKEWLRIITPDQQAAIRRRNRKTILQASLQRPQSAQSLLNGEESLETLMSNSDLLSVIERPEVQDMLEFTDEQLEKIEELQFAAEADALRTLRQAMESLKQKEAAPDAISTPNRAWERLNAETMEILTAEQVARYENLRSDPGQMQALFIADGAQTQASRFRAMMPHGIPTRVSTTVVDGKARVTAEFNNAFASPTMAMTLQLTEEQQGKIVDVLENARDEMLAEMATRTEAWKRQQEEKSNRFADVLRHHNEQFHVQAVSMMTPAQLEKLEKERLRGLGLRALQKPELRSTLELTEVQVKAIDEILSRRGPQMEMKPINPEADFQQESEDFHKRAREHSRLATEHVRKQERDVQDLLSETQRSQFTEMTGHRFVTGASL